MKESRHRISISIHYRDESHILDVVVSHLINMPNPNLTDAPFWRKFEKRFKNKQDELTGKNEA